MEVLGGLEGLETMDASTRLEARGLGGLQGGTFEPADDEFFVERMALAAKVRQPNEQASEKWRFGGISGSL